MRGEVETEDGILVIRRIFVNHRLAAPEDVRNVVEDVHQAYPMKCPLYRTLTARCTAASNSTFLTSSYQGRGQVRRANSRSELDGPLASSFAAAKLRAAAAHRVSTESVWWLFRISPTHNNQILVRSECVRSEELRCQVSVLTVRHRFGAERLRLESDVPA